MFGLAKNATIHVAEPSSVSDDQSVSYGTPQEIDVRWRQNVEVDGYDDLMDKITTDEYQFTERTGVWLPGSNTNSDADAKKPKEQKSATLGSTTVSSVVL